MNLIFIIDSSILIDLINIDLLELTCKLADKIYITDFVENEISNENQKNILHEFIFSKKIKVIISNDSQLSDIREFYSIYSSKLSISTVFLSIMENVWRLFF